MRNLFLLIMSTILLSCSKEEKRESQDGKLIIADSLPANSESKTDSSVSDKVMKFDLAQIEEQLADSTLDKLFLKTSDLYVFNNREAFDKYYHFSDLDKDGDLDLLYDGWSGSEPMMFEISMNVEGNFRKQFNDFIYLKDLFFSSDSIIDSLIIDNPGCCAMMTKSLNYYSIDIKKDTVMAKLQMEEVFHYAEGKPKKYLEKPIKFEIQNEKYWLRITPEIDSTNWYTEEWKGNRFMEFNKGDKGIALAEKADSTGRIWWYSRLKVKDYFVHGWMSSRYLEME